MQKDKIWLLMEIYESRDQCRVTTVRMASFDRGKVVRFARELYEEDEYGFFEKYGTEFENDTHYESVYANECFVVYMVVCKEVE